MPIDNRMVKKGMTVPLAGVLDQGRVHEKLGTELATPLGQYGYLPADQSQLSSTLATLSTDRAQAVDARSLAHKNTGDERTALSAVKRVKRLVVSAAGSLHKDGEITDADRDAFHAGTLLGRSTALHSKYLTDIRATVVRLGPQLGPLLGGEDPVAMLDQAKAALDATQATQEVSIAALPEDTAQVYEAKGRLLTLIEKMNGAASRAFDGDALTRARFNKDLILRAVKTRPAKPAQPA